MEKEIENYGNGKILEKIEDAIAFGMATGLVGLILGSISEGIMANPEQSKEYLESIDHINEYAFYLCGTVGGLAKGYLNFFKADQ